MFHRVQVGVCLCGSNSTEAPAVMNIYYRSIRQSHLYWIFQSVRWSNVDFMCWKRRGWVLGDETINIICAASFQQRKTTTKSDTRESREKMVKHKHSKVVHYQINYSLINDRVYYEARSSVEWASNKLSFNKIMEITNMISFLELENKYFWCEKFEIFREKIKYKIRERCELCLMFQRISIHSLMTIKWNCKY